MGKINSEDLRSQIGICLINLSILAEKHCRNKLSQNYSFILYDFNEFRGRNLLELEKSEVEINKQETPQTLEMIIEKLEAEYSDLYDVVFYVFKAAKSETIIEIEYFRKSNLDIDYFQKVKANHPMFHSKIKMPYYWKNGDKVDINWHFGGVRYGLNIIIYKLRSKRIKMETTFKGGLNLITSFCQSYK